MRPAAIELARRSHGEIRYLVYDGEALPLEPESVNWVSICTVMSSIDGADARRHLADDMVRVLAPGGHVFYWDLARAKAFAGGDALEPAALFPSLALVSDDAIRVEGRIERYFPGRVLQRTLLPLIERLATPRTHRACLLRKAITGRRAG